MKSRKLQFLEAILRWMSSVVIKKYKPDIVGISGSVGKTSVKEAVFTVLSFKFRVRKNLKNYNNEIGIPLTIIGAETGGRSILKWLAVFLKWLGIIIFPCRYPEILVLEMGIDRPGDIKYLTSFIPIKVGILTNISSSHLEFFRDVNHIAGEKGRLIEILPEEGLAVLNADDKRVLAIEEKSEARVVTFGFNESAQIRASDADFNYIDGSLEGLSFKLNYEGKFIPVRLNYILAKHQIYSVLAAIATGNYFKINLVDAVTSLENYMAPPGRTNLIKGIKNSFIIDDSYNASPASASAALEVLKELRSVRKIAVLGDMLELGKDMERGHKEVGRKVFETGIDLFFAVGERMESAVKEIQNLGYPLQNIFYFENPVLAGKKLQQIIKEGDLILIKGSQGMRMEKIVEEIMADPQEAKSFLCRQSKEWRKKPFTKP